MELSVVTSVGKYSSLSQASNLLQKFYQQKLHFLVTN